MQIEKEILEAVARGWCHDKNSDKPFDHDLAGSIVEEIIKLSPYKKMAIEVIRVISERQQDYEMANKVLSKLNPDFPQYVRGIDDKIEASVVALLDKILGDEIASYFLFEVCLMKRGGSIIEKNGRQWKIKTIDDVVAYVNRGNT